MVVEAFETAKEGDLIIVRDAAPADNSEGVTAIAEVSAADDNSHDLTLKLLERLPIAVPTSKLLEDYPTDKALRDALNAHGTLIPIYPVPEV